MRAGLDRSKLLPVGTGSFDLTAGVARAWDGGMDAFIRAQLEWHPRDSITAFAFAQADRLGVQAGLGTKITF